MAVYYGCLSLIQSNFQTSYLPERNPLPEIEEITYSSSKIPDCLPSYLSDGALSQDRVILCLVSGDFYSSLTRFHYLRSSRESKAGSPLPTPDRDPDVRRGRPTPGHSLPFLKELDPCPLGGNIPVQFVFPVCVHQLYNSY